MPLDIPRINPQPDDIAASLVGYSSHVKEHGGERSLKLLKPKEGGFLAFNMIKPIALPPWLTDASFPLPKEGMVRITTFDDLVDAIHDLSDIVRGMYSPGLRKVIDEVFEGTYTAALEQRPDGDAIWIGSRQLILLLHGEDV